MIVLLSGDNASRIRSGICIQLSRVLIVNSLRVPWVQLGHDCSLHMAYASISGGVVCSLWGMYISASASWYSMHEDCRWLNLLACGCIFCGSPRHVGLAGLRTSELVGLTAASLVPGHTA